MFENLNFLDDDDEKKSGKLGESSNLNEPSESELDKSELKEGRAVPERSEEDKVEQEEPIPRTDRGVCKVVRNGEEGWRFEEGSVDKDALIESIRQTYKELPARSSTGGGSPKGNFLRDMCALFKLSTESVIEDPDETLNELGDEIHKDGGMLDAAMETGTAPLFVDSEDSEDVASDESSLFIDA